MAKDGNTGKEGKEGKEPLIFNKDGSPRKRRGRPYSDIDKEQFESLCALQCNSEEISGFFRVNKDTLYNWCKRTYGELFSVVYNRYSANGLISLRRNQMKLSERSAGMAIFMGKQYLGQSENPQGYMQAEVEDLQVLKDMLK